ncbi:MAG TPA: DUF222 domain-containing protein [Nocardioidaceae bacterium]|nr:DUF222 domain-containing protein [Nocardioidaceae bacterium]
MSISQDRPAGTGADKAPDPGWTVPGVGSPAQRISSESDAGDRSDRADSVDREDLDGLEDLTGAGTPGSGGVGHPVVVAVASCLEALDGIKDSPAVGLSAKEIRLMMLAVVHLTAALFALKLRLLVAAEVHRVQDLTGATSVPAFLSHLTQIPRAEASAQLRLARDLDRRWPLLAQALAAGQVSPDQVKIAVTALRRLPKDLSAEQTEAVQKCLIEAAQSMTPRQLKAVGRRLWEVIDPEGADERAGKDLEDEEELARAKAYFRSWRNGDGTTGFRGKLPDVQADMLLKALAAFASPRRRSNPHIKTHQPDDNHPDSTAAGNAAANGSTHAPGNADDDADTAAARPSANPDGPSGEPDPAEPAGDDDPPDPPDPGAPPGASRLFDPAEAGDLSPEERQTGRVVPYPVRLGRALMELLERLPADLLPATGGVGATVVVTVTLEQLTSGLGTATLDTGTEISYAQLRRLACEAGIIPAVLDGEGQPLDLGREQRLFSRSQRVAMNLRDQGCRAEGCDRPSAWTVAHHLTEWCKGGRTDIADGVMVCDYHHHLIHATKWNCTLRPDGDIRFRRR